MFKGVLHKIKHFYDKSYKKILIIPFLLLFISILLIAHKVITTGDFINRGVSLKGGITITIPIVESTDASEFQNYLESKFPEDDISVRILKKPGEADGLIIDAGIEDKEGGEAFKKEIETKLHIQSKDYSDEVMGSSLGSSFFKETIKAVIIAFIFMSIVVFLYFRVLTPSIAVLLAAFSDIITTLAIVNLLDIQLSTAGIAAFLMLIGYSVDTDILLSTKVLKTKEGSVTDRIFDAMSTGLMMSATTLAAITVALIFSESDVLIQIMTILFIGLMCDLIYTWFQNASILKIHAERKRHKHE